MICSHRIHVNCGAHCMSNFIICTIYGRLFYPVYPKLAEHGQAIFKMSDKELLSNSINCPVKNSKCPAKPKRSSCALFDLKFDKFVQPACVILLRVLLKRVMCLDNRL